MKTVLCYGDSNTWGYHAKEDNRFDWHTRYPGVLSRLLGEEYHVIEDGLCGRTTQYESDIELYVNGKKAAELAAEVHAPLDYAVIMLGTNDCKDMYNASPEDIRKGIEGIAACFEQKGAKILLIAPVPMRGLEKSPFYHEFGIRAEEKSLLLAGIYAQLAHEKDWLYLDADEIIVTGEFDHIHLEAEAHGKLAEAVFRMIAQEK